MIHSSLMEVYDFVTCQLTAKEQELNKSVADRVKEAVEKANSTRDALKALNSQTSQV